MKIACFLTIVVLSFLVSCNDEEKRFQKASYLERQYEEYVESDDLVKQLNALSPIETYILDKFPNTVPSWYSYVLALTNVRIALLCEKLGRVEEEKIALNKMLLYSSSLFEKETKYQEFSDSEKIEYLREIVLELDSCAKNGKKGTGLERER